MQELVDTRYRIGPTETLLVAALTGQEAVGVAQTFNERVGASGLILTKMDGVPVAEISRGTGDGPWT